MRRSLPLLLVLLIVAACGGPQPSGDRAGGDGTPVVAAVNYPLAWLAERIGGDAVEVRLPAPGGVDPAWWVPDDAAVEAFQEADLILLNGASYAKWVEKRSLPSSKLVDTSQAAAERYIELEHATTHTHGPEGAHAHKGTAFTTWLDPELLLVQAEAVKNALVRLVPDAADAMEARYAELTVTLHEMAQRMKAAVAEHRDRPVFFSHPVYQYLERALDLNGRSVHWEPDTEPDEAMWKEFDQERESHPAKWMIWESEPLPAVVEKLRERGVESVVFDPAGNRPDEGDFLTTMERNAEALEKVYR